MATIAILVSLAIAYISIRTSWDIAQRSGALLQAELRFGLGQFAFDPYVETQLLIGARKLSGNGSVVVGEIPYTLSNVGDASLDDATVTFQFHEAFRRDALEQLQLNLSGSIYATKIERSFSEGRTLHYSSYLIPRLDPSVAINGAEPLYLPRTQADIDVPVTLEDGRSGRATLRAKYSLSFLVTVAARNIAAQGYRVSIRTAEASSMQALDEIAQRTVIPERRKAIRENSSFAGYLGLLLFSALEESLFLVYQDLEERPVDDGSLFFLRTGEAPASRLIRFSPASWHYLFE